MFTIKPGLVIRMPTPRDLLRQLFTIHLGLETEFQITPKGVQVFPRDWHLTGGTYWCPFDHEVPLEDLEELVDEVNAEMGPDDETNPMWQEMQAMDRVANVAALPRRRRAS